MAGDQQKYTAEEKARHAARVREREARKKERQKQKKALTKQAAPARRASGTLTDTNTRDTRDTTRRQDGLHPAEGEHLARQPDAGRRAGLGGVGRF